MKKYIFSCILLFTMGVFSSCNSLDVPPPNNITDEQIMEILKGNDTTKINLVLKAIGSSLQNNFNITGKSYLGYSDNNQNSQIDQDFVRNLMGNDVVNGNITSNGSWHGPFYDLISTFNKHNHDWPYFALCCDVITNANKAIQYLTTNNQSVKEYRGRALAVRAYGYMLLMERFQRAYTNGGSEGKGMPIYTEYKINDPAPISSAKETYEFILKDLKEAVTYLETVGYTTTIFNDIDKGVAQYLLARAALWNGAWNDCITACKDILIHYPVFISEASYGGKTSDLDAIVANDKEIEASQNAFFSIAVNPETILAFKNGESGNTNLLYQYANIFAPGQGGYGMMWPCIDNRLYEKMDNRDFRKDNYLTHKSGEYTYVYNKQGQTEKRIIDQYANMKFAATISMGSNVRDYQMNCDIIVLRSSEIYLMLAEAYAQSGKEAQAKDILNKLLAARTKAGMETLTCDNYLSMKGMTTLEMVQFQERIEMWCEKGLEFYNNKRWNIPVDRNNSVNHFSSIKTLSVDDMTLEIPLEETSTNTNWEN